MTGSVQVTFESEDKNASLTVASITPTEMNDHVVQIQINGESIDLLEDELDLLIRTLITIQHAE